jgi:hypothetical protein
MSAKFQSIGYYWATPCERLKDRCPTSPCIVMVRCGEQKVYVSGSGHYFYRSEFDFGEFPKEIQIPDNIK